MNHQPQQNNPDPQKKRTENKDNNSVKSFARYTGIAVQMIVIIGIMTFAGVKLDERRGAETPVFTLILSLLGVFAAIYTAIRDLLKKDN